MRILVIGSLLFTFVYVPVYVAQTLVVPQVEKLQQTYQGYDEVTQEVARGAFPGLDIQ
jgi:hypothetical protein